MLKNLYLPLALPGYQGKLQNAVDYTFMDEEIWQSYTWYSLKEAAIRVGLEEKRIRTLIKDHHLVALRRGEGQVLQIPEAFLTQSNGKPGVLDSLYGTMHLLLDGGFSVENAVAWLLSEEPSLGTTPVQALIAGRKKEVRRVAGALAW